MIYITRGFYHSGNCCPERGRRTGGHAERSRSMALCTFQYRGYSSTGSQIFQNYNYSELSKRVNFGILTHRMTLQLVALAPSTSSGRKVLWTGAQRIIRIVQFVEAIIERFAAANALSMMFVVGHSERSRRVSFCIPTLSRTLLLQGVRPLRQALGPGGQDQSPAANYFSNAIYNEY